MPPTAIPSPQCPHTQRGLLADTAAPPGRYFRSQSTPSTWWGGNQGSEVRSLCSGPHIGKKSRKHATGLYPPNPGPYGHCSVQ